MNHIYHPSFKIFIPQINLKNLNNNLSYSFSLNSASTDNNSNSFREQQYQNQFDDILLPPHYLKNFTSLSPIEVKEIYTQIIKEESNTLPIFLDLSYHPQIGAIHLAILFDWLINAHNFFNHSDQCVFLTVSIIKDYLSKTRNFEKNKLQLLGLTALMISSKYFDKKCPNISTLSKISDNSINKEQFINFEYTVLRTIDFKIEGSNMYSLMDVLSIMFNLNWKELEQARFFLELTLLDIAFERYSRVLICYSVVYLIMKINLDNHQDYKKLFVYSSEIGINEKEIKMCGKEILNLKENVDRCSTYTSSREKYESRVKNSIDTFM